MEDKGASVLLTDGLSADGPSNTASSDSFGTGLGEIEIAKASWSACVLFVNGTNAVIEVRNADF